MDPSPEATSDIREIVDLSWDDARPERAITDSRDRRAHALPPRPVFDG